MMSETINAAVRNPNRINNNAGYAYFPGTGPSLRSCAECTFAAKAGQHTHCRKWSDPKKSAKRGPAINPSSESCKFFEKKGV